MLYYTASQPLQFALMLLSGMLIAAVALGFAGIRRLMRAGFWLSLICDLLMGISWAAIFCGALTIASSGVLRAFHIIAALAGAALFHSALSVPVMRIAGKLSAAAGRACRRAAGYRFVRALFR